MRNLLIIVINIDSGDYKRLQRITHKESMMQCKICQREFTPNKYHPNQQVCSGLECQHLRQILNEKEWRNKNPEYFKCRDQETSWRVNRHLYSRQWRIVHKDYLKKYERNHRHQRREYMREYMRRYRAVHRSRAKEFGVEVNQNKS